MKLKTVPSKKWGHEHFWRCEDEYVALEASYTVFASKEVVYFPRIKLPTIGQREPKYETDTCLFANDD